MTQPQITLFAIFAAIVVLLVQGRLRHDLIAFGALLAGVLTGVVPANRAFEGFGHPATVTVALVLVATAGLVRSGAVGRLARLVTSPERSVTAHVGLMGLLGAVLSAGMNNVAALALLMPVDMQVARKAGRAAGLTLMPLAFATVLGGITTAIGTPPNLIVSGFREEAKGQPFAMLDFLPVGGPVALAGVVFIALVGWRLLPQRAQALPAATRAGHIAELRLPEGHAALGESYEALDRLAESNDAALIAVLREGKRLRGPVATHTALPGDALLVEAAPQALDAFRAEARLAFPDGREDAPEDVPAAGGGQVLLELLITPESRARGQSARAMGLSWRHDAVLIGLKRGGKTLQGAIRKMALQEGDVALLVVPEATRDDVIAWLGALPLETGATPVTLENRALATVGLFLGAIALAAFGLAPMAVALGLAIVGMVMLGVLSGRSLYAEIDWSIIVLLGAMIPLGLALDSTGGSALIASALGRVTHGLPPWVAIAVIMAATMFISDVLNNNATAILAAPVALRLAQDMGHNPDSFLMAVAIGASCSFLTPIGHQNNTLVMGPGGYRFSDYWRIGLPLEMIVMAITVPLLLIVFPL